MNHDADVERLVRFYETMSRDTLAEQLGQVYAADAWFKDPFNEVRGIGAIRTIFEHMFEQVEQARFVVSERMVQGEQAFLTWEFHFRHRRIGDGAVCIRGASHLRFGANGLVTLHRDYWDAAEELYEKIPLLGALMRWLKRSAN